LKTLTETTAVPEPRREISSIDQLLDAACDIAALPQVVMRVINLTMESKTTAAELERAIGTDQALAAKMLTLANSSYYGLPRRISSLREAVIFLGFKTVRQIAMAVTTFNVFLGKADTLSLSRRALWRHSLDTAQCARLVSTRLHASDREKFGSEEAFTGGLLHDIGKMAMDQYLHTPYLMAMTQAAEGNIRFADVEQYVLPFTHSAAGAALAERWNLPPALCECIACHHAPRAAQINMSLTATICLANEITHALNDGCDRLKAAEVLEERLRMNADELQAAAALCRIELDKGLCLLSFV